MKEVDVIVANEGHIKYVDTILKTIADAAKVRGTGIAKRSPEYVATKMRHLPASVTLRLGATSIMSPHQVLSYTPITADWDWPSASKHLPSHWHESDGPTPKSSRSPAAQP